MFNVSGIGKYEEDENILGYAITKFCKFILKETISDMSTGHTT